MFLQHLTSSLLAVAFLSSFGSSMLYGYNLAVVNSPAQVTDTNKHKFSHCLTYSNTNRFFMQLDWIAYLLKHSLFTYFLLMLIEGF